MSVGSDRRDGIIYPCMITLITSAVCARNLWNWLLMQKFCHPSWFWLLRCSPTGSEVELVSYSAQAPWIDFNLYVLPYCVACVAMIPWPPIAEWPAYFTLNKYHTMPFSFLWFAQPGPVQVLHWDNKALSWVARGPPQSLLDSCLHRGLGTYVETVVSLDFIIIFDTGNW